MFQVIWNYKIAISIGICLIIGTCLKGQHPGWVKPNAASFSYNATCITVVFVDDIRAQNPDDLVAFFVGDEIRGLGKSISTGSGNYVHFITLYSNVATEPMSVKFYNKITNTVYESGINIIFKVQAKLGTVDNPMFIRVYTDNDAPINILNVPVQNTIQGLAFGQINMANYLIQPDPDPVLWSFTPNPDLTVVFAGSTLQVSGAAGFSGTAMLTVRATEQTPNEKYAEITIIFIVAAAYEPPLWNVIPGQGIAKGDQFQVFDLDDYEHQYGGPCITYDYQPVISVSDNPDSMPDWHINGYFQNNMTLTVRIKFTPKYTFNHPDDKVTALINGEVRGVALPVYASGKITYFLTIGGGAATETFLLKFYSGALKKVLTYRSTLQYIPHRIEGSADNPYIIDFAAIEPIIGFDGSVYMAIRDTAWTGEQTFIFSAKDCSYPQFMQDFTNASFCIASNSSFLNNYYADNDGDGYGNPLVFIKACSNPGSGYVENNLDCDDTNPDIVGIVVNIQITENSGIAPNDGNICYGSPVIMTASGGNTYLWSTGQSTAILNLFPLQSSSYTVTVSNIAGCTGTKTQSITVENNVVLNNNNTGPGSLRYIMVCVAEGGTILYDQPFNNLTILTTPLIIDKNVNINGLNSNARPIIAVDFNQTNQGIILSENKTLTLRNLDLKLINPQNKVYFTGAGSVSIAQITKVVIE
jgi:hypothetical protein